MTKEGKKISKEIDSVQQKDMHLERQIAENLVALQKINVDLTEKFDKLAGELSNLLALFEVAARNFAKNAPIGEYEKDKEFIDKIDKLLEQNKVLAKGLTMVEERMRERMYSAPVRGPPQAREDLETEKLPASGKPLPKF
jgi:hypothetical protein